MTEHKSKDQEVKMEEKPIVEKAVHAHPENKTHEHKTEPIVEHKPAKEDKPKTEVKKESPKPKITKKDEAIAHGHSMPLSKRHCMYISAFIKNKKIDQAIADLEQVIKFKKIVPFKGEIPHRKGKGMMSGRYPIKASKMFIKLLKGLRGNVLVNGMDLEKTKIIFGSANWASRPMRKGGARAKRTHVLIKAMESKEE
ncbi:MAG: hypothetical protein Q7S27_01980 [Nanoarchaeota archaeon]|nr:hypothetical protein [Nanoarchaeota archaeon]